MPENKNDDLANQAIDIIFENDALQTRIIDPIKRKAIPYLLCFGIFNLILFILVAFIAPDTPGLNEAICSGVRFGNIMSLKFDMR